MATPTSRLPLLLVLVRVLVACSSSADPPTAPAGDGGAAAHPDGTELSGGGTDATAAPSDATPEGAADETRAEGDADVLVHDPVHQCPGCQASKCLKELNACGGSSVCVGWLICMNDCFKAADAAKCQAGCTAAEPTPQGKALLACDETRCHDECTP